MNVKLNALILVLASLAFSPAQARQRWAPVVRVVPVTEQIRVDREVCRDYTTTRHTRRGNTATGTIVGAVVGGALGNQVGKGDGRKAATVAGAVIGGAVGRDIDRRNNPRRAVTEHRTRCHIEPTWQTVRMFDVTYRDRGRHYTRRMDLHPGTHVRVYR
jgi:uncharacterized protein YcfJ